MTAVDLVAKVEALGARVWRLGDRLRVVPAGRLTPDLRAELSRCKADLLAVLPEAPPEIAALPAVALAAPIRDMLEANRTAFDRRQLDHWSLARRARWSARAACLEIYAHLSPAEADERALREVGDEPEPGMEVIVRAGPPGHFALAFESEPPASVSLTAALAAIEVANQRWDRGDDAGCQAAMERLEVELDRLRVQAVRAWLVS